MRQLIESTLVSLDGIVGSPWEWAMSYFGEDSKRESLVELEQADTFLLGRVTYENFVASWSQIKGDPYFDRINSMHKLVASTTLRETAWNATVIQGDVAEALAGLKRQPGKNIVKYGTGRLTRTLVEHKLIDEFHLSVVPVVVGGGQRLFEGVDPAKFNLELAETKTFESGVVGLTYLAR